MKLNSLITVLYEENWHITAEYQAHITHAKEKSVLVMPTPSSNVLPEGTANAVLTYMHKRPQFGACLMPFAHYESIPVIFEKSNTTLWARIELPDFLLVTHGCTENCLIERLRSLLNHMTLSSQRPVETLNLRPVYDTSAVWELLREFKSARIAEQSGIDTQLLNKIMAGAAHPCSEQTERLETSLRKLGKQLTLISLH